jgi:hypothetical protein
VVGRSAWVKALRIAATRRRPWLRAVGSAALAAHTGHLPARAQQTAHELLYSWGVPAPPGAGPTRRARPSRDAAGDWPGTATAPTAPTAPSPTAPGSRPVPTPARPPAAPPPSRDEPSLYVLCRIYVAHQRYPDSPPLDEAQLRRLAAAAGGGGEARIAGFCYQRFGLSQPPAGRPMPPPQRNAGTPPPDPGARRAEAAPTRSPGPREPESTASPRR